MGELGKIGYEAYCARSDWKSLVNGDRLPAWEDLNIEIRDAWNSVGEAYGKFFLE